MYSRKSVVFLCCLFAFGHGYMDKEPYITSDFLRDIVSRMNKDLDSYVDFPDTRLPLGVRSINKNLEEEQLYPLDYDSFAPNGGDSGLHPSIRDQEFLQHSSLWGSQYVSGGAGEGQQRLNGENSYKNRQEIKTDSTLPAYCNPPNPCPIGYTGDSGCLEEFENTASFSRRYQASQDCMCDTEHMFNCPNNQETQDDAIEALNELKFNQFLQHSLQVDPSLHHKSLVAKKYYEKNIKGNNPFLTGEKLPVAAKKGNNVYY